MGFNSGFKVLSGMILHGESVASYGDVSSILPGDLIGCNR